MNRAMLISAAGLACCAGLLSAGSLTPPAGPIGGSFKTLGEGGAADCAEQHERPGRCGFGVPHHNARVVLPRGLGGGSVGQDWD
jgi:hypothetical protein